MEFERGLPESLRGLRRTRGLRLKEAARRAGVSVNSLVGWESGRQVPTGRSLARTLDALDAPLRTKARLLAAIDPQYARIALADTPLGPPLGVGTILRAMRARRQVTQAEVARRVGVTQGAVAKWESGDSTPSPQTLHEVGFALGASVEETLALASAQGGSPDGLPDKPAPVLLDDRIPVGLREVVALGQEAELWRRAALDARWETALGGILAIRANLYLLEGRFGEAADVAERSLRLATTTEGRTAAVPAVNALNEVAIRRGGGHLTAARTCAEWAERLPDSLYRAWMLSAQGMHLTRAGGARQGIDLVQRARDMEYEIEAFGPAGEPRPGHGRAQSLADACLAAGMPGAAREALEPFRCHDTDQLLYARVEHANGRPLDPAALAYVRHTVLRVPTNLSWKNLRTLDGIERNQTRLTGGPSAMTVEGPGSVEEARRLWAAVPGGLPWAVEAAPDPKNRE